MPYNYKGFTLPVFKDKNWHEYVDPRFRDLIDKDESYNSQINELYTLIVPTTNYVIEQYDEIDNTMYSLRTHTSDWVVYKVIDNNSIFTTLTASISNNPMIIDKNDAWNNRYILIYT